MPNHVELRDRNGAAIDANNPLPVTLAEPASANASVITLLDGVTSTTTGAAVAMPYGSFPRNVIITLTGSGAVAATVQIWGGNTSDCPIFLGESYDLAGTDSDYADAAIERPYPYLLAKVTAISGTGAAVTVTTGY